MNAIFTIADDHKCFDGKEKPFLTGKDLIAQGMKPGPKMGDILKAVYEAQLNGTILNCNDAMKMVEGLK
jgi:hypothetical protein